MISSKYSPVLNSLVAIVRVANVLVANVPEYDNFEFKFVPFFYNLFCVMLEVFRYRGCQKNKPPFFQPTVLEDWFENVTNLLEGAKNSF